MIRMVKESGFCYGVQAAVDTANATEKAYLYGDLVNNTILMEDFKSRGYTIVENAEDIPPNSTVIIRAHGVPKSVYKSLNKIKDCTCPKVRNIHKIVEEKSHQGYQVIIIGKNGHPEVVGIHGWCKEGSATVAETPADLKFNNQPLCVVAQTTCKKSWWEEAVEIIKANKPDAEIFNTLCSVTDQRIVKATEMAKESDIMIVVGDEKSANSKELNHACKNVNPNTFFVTSIGDVININPNAQIGIAGSASTPMHVIEEIHDYLVFAKFLSQAKNEISSQANKYLQAEKQEPFIDEAIKNLCNQHEGGKCIRGTMVKLGAEIASKGSGYLPVAAAYEIFQTSILIHDDIIDKSYTRRGKKTIHASYQDTHFGISQAICIGDYGLFTANKILAESGLEPEILVKIFKLFSKIQLITLEGEIMDVTLPYKPIDPNDESYTDIVNKIFEYKTAWYTLVGPVMLGATLGGGDENLINKLKSIAMPLGIAFQIKDDLLGIFANEETLGKPALSDVAEKKQTLLYGYAYKNANQSQKSNLIKSYGNPDATAEDLEITRKIFTETGAKKYCEDEILRLSGESLKHIDESGFSKEHKILLKGLVGYLLTRRY